MLKRISNKKPAISRERLENDWQQNLTFMNNISAFPEDWYLRDRTARSNPSLNTSINNNTSKSRDETLRSTRGNTDTKPEKDSKNDEVDDKSDS